MSQNKKLKAAKASALRREFRAFKKQQREKVSASQEIKNETKHRFFDLFGG